MVHTWTPVIGPPIIEQRKARGRGPSPRDASGGGRFRLGIGPSHRPMIEGTYGLPFTRPLEHLREYATVLEQAFGDGKVDFEGQQFKVHGQVPDPPAVPLYLAALRAPAHELAGEVADGSISWVTPAAYLRGVARPALLRGAA